MFRFLEQPAGRFEPMNAEAFDYILLLSFILLVPVATVVCVVSKLRHAQTWEPVIMIIITVIATR